MNITCKPRIWFNRHLGVWMCSERRQADWKVAYQIGLGVTPEEAYENWRRP